MAKIIRRVDDIKNIKGTDCLIEIEYIEFVDDSGNVAKFKMKGITPINTGECMILDKNTDWDYTNFHFVADIDLKIGEIK